MKLKVKIFYFHQKDTRAVPKPIALPSRNEPPKIQIKFPTAVKKEPTVKAALVFD